MASLVASIAGVDTLNVAPGFQDAGFSQRPAATSTETTANSPSRASDEVTLSSIARRLLVPGSAARSDTPRDDSSAPRSRSAEPVAATDTAPRASLDLASAYKALIAFLDQVSPSEKASGSWMTRRVNAQYSYEQALRNENAQSSGPASTSGAGRYLREIATFLSSMKEGRVIPEPEVARKTPAVTEKENPVPAMETAPARRPGVDIKA